MSYQHDLECFWEAYFKQLILVPMDLKSDILWNINIGYIDVNEFNIVGKNQDFSY